MEAAEQQRESARPTYISPEDMKDFLANLSYGCIELLEKIPDSVAQIARLLKAIFNRVSSSFQKAFIDRLLGLVSSCIDVRNWFISLIL